MPVGLGLLILGLAACSAGGAGQGTTAGQLAGTGKTIFQGKCVKCHGESGQKVNGSALLGPDNVLVNYQTGLGLYDYISKFMPNDQPGSLTPAQYLQVESFLLEQNRYVQSDTPVDANTLDRILLQR